LARDSAHFPDFGNPAVADGDITMESRQAGTVNNIAVLYNQIVWHLLPLSSGWRQAPLPLTVCGAWTVVL
jgi:hypothetical protein